MMLIVTLGLVCVTLALCVYVEVSMRRNARMVEAMRRQLAESRSGLSGRPLTMGAATQHDERTHA